MPPENPQEVSPPAPSAMNRVTWYSKIIALALFVVMPFLGFYLGIRYGEAIQLTQDIAGRTLLSLRIPPPGDYYADIAAWQTNVRNDGGFSIAYPIDFETNDVHAAKPSADWSMSGVAASGASIPGNLYFTLAVPRAFEPQTNFGDAKITVGASKNASAVKNCLWEGADTGPAATSTALVNGVQFAVLRSTDAGAGNLYETAAYHTVRNGQCYAIEYTIHSTQIANYPKEYGLHPFDETRVRALLDRIVGTVKFL